MVVDLSAGVASSSTRVAATGPGSLRAVALTWVPPCSLPHRRLVSTCRGLGAGSSRAELRPLYVSCLSKTECWLQAGPTPAPVGTLFTIGHGRSPPSSSAPSEWHLNECAGQPLFGPHQNSRRSSGKTAQPRTGGSYKPRLRGLCAQLGFSRWREAGRLRELRITPCARVRAGDQGQMVTLPCAR